MAHYFYYSCCFLFFGVFVHVLLSYFMVMLIISVVHNLIYILMTFGFASLQVLSILHNHVYI